MEKQSIKQWYCNEYPEDEMGEGINPDITFEDLFNVLDNYQNVYEALGVDDSIIRERAFAKLATIMGVEYDYIYDQWMRA